MMKRILSISFMIFCAITLMAQSVNLNTETTGKTVDGIVVDDANFPIIGATVKVKNTDNGTITDFDGNFSLTNVKTGQYLQIYYIGYKT